MIRRGLFVASLVVTVGSLAAIRPALAWTPYTHLHTANQARQALIDDGGIKINGVVYPVRAEVVTAITNFPEYFNGGVVGPDGMPDITYGQAVIHPDHSGKWLAYLLDKAWAAYRARGGDAEGQKILAFTYGYLAHGAGDMWAHTYVNDFAEHVFPAVTDIFKNLVKVPPSSDNTRDLATALRHLVAEGYVGDATPGYDGNPEPGPAPGRDCPADNPLCKRSDRSTPGFDLDAPHGFVYDTLINPNITLPVKDHSGPAADGASRGPVINFFLDLRAGLVSAGGSLTPNPGVLLDDLRNTANHFGDAFSDANAAINACTDDLFSTACAEAALRFIFITPFELAIRLAEDGFNFIADAAIESIKAAFGPFLIAYLNAWIADIDDGLRHWNELGLGITKALFDPQTRRDLQEEDCSELLTQGAIDTCNEGIGLSKVLLDPISGTHVNDFINDHLLSMLGLPDLVGELRGFFQDAAEFIEDKLCGIPGIDFLCNLERTVVAIVQELAEEVVRAIVKEVFGIDLEELEKLTSNLGAFMTLEQVLPGNIASQLFGSGASGGINFFQPGSHDRTDGYLGLAADHHEPAPEPISGFPIPAQRLSDEAQYATTFAAANNTVMQEKLLMLDGSQLNLMLGDILTGDGIIQSRDKVQTYVDGVTPANIMVSSLGGSDPWLLLFDGDHAWRQDGLPRFCSLNGPCITPADRLGPGPVSTRIATDPVGGNGRNPIWESCVLRPAFSKLFTDWEDGSLPFQEWGDGVSADDNTDPNAPAPFLEAQQPKFQSGATLFVGPTTPFVFTATEQTFTASQVDLRYRSTHAGDTPGAFTDVPDTLSAPPFTLPADGAEGSWTVEAQTADPCHTFAAETVGEPGDTTLSVVLDKTPPVITIVSPPAAVFDSSDFSTVQATADDGPTGSGVASLTATLDGVPVALGSTLDMFLLAPGTHTVTFRSVDNVGNASTASVTFRILATPQSLLDNLDRARAAGLFPGDPLFGVVRKHVAKALDELAKGHLGGASGSLNAALRELLTARDRNRGEVDPHIADLLISSLSELIATLGQPLTAIDSNKSLGVLEALLREYLAGNVSAHGAFEQLRLQITQAVGDHFAGQRSQEINDLGGFSNRIALLLSHNSSPCASRELACFNIDADAASRLTAAAQAVIAAL